MLERGVSTKCSACTRRWRREHQYQPVHGHCTRVGKTPTYRTWYSMTRRCFYPPTAGFKNYGGRGITIDPSWLQPKGLGFLNFLRDMGERPAGTSIDRINPDGNYEPGNCRWATPKEQAANRRPHDNRPGWVKRVGRPVQIPAGAFTRLLQPFSWRG
jgi:hypothetical protein